MCCKTIILFTVIISIFLAFAVGASEFHPNRTGGNILTSAITEITLQLPPGLGHTGGPRQKESTDPLTLAGRWPSGPCFSVAIHDGLTFFGDGGYLTIADPELVGKRQILGRTMLPAFIRGLDSDGTYACCANWLDGMRIVDISDPTTPTEVGYYVDFFGNALDVAFHNGFVYLITSGAKIHIVDISDPTSPVRVGTIGSASSQYTDITFAGFLAYATHDNYGLRIFDISNPKIPVFIGSYEENAGVAQSVAVKDNYAFVADGIAGLLVLDVSDPAEPFFAGEYTEHWVRDIAIDGNTACAISNGGFRVFDISTPTNPIETAYLEDSETMYSWIQVKMYGETAYSANGDGGLYIIDVSDPYLPTIIGHYQTGGQAEKLVAEDEYLYLAAANTGLHVLDISNIATPFKVAQVTTESRANGIVLQDGFAFIPTKIGLEIIDISNPLFPLVRSQCATLSSARDVAVLGNYAYVIGNHSNQGYLQVVDVSDPDTPTPLGISGFGWDSYYNIAVSGPNAFISSNDCHIYVVDISNPLEHSFVGSWEYMYCVARVFGLAISGNYLYTSTCDKFFILDISDPTDIVELSHISISASLGSAYDISVCGDYAYLASGHYGIEVIDISNPNGPISLGFYDTGHYGYGVDCRELEVYLADDYDGVYTFNNGIVSVFLVDFTIQQIQDSITIQWTISSSADFSSFRLVGNQANCEREIAFQENGAGQFSATDYPAHFSESISYSLFYVSEGENLELLANKTLNLTPPQLKTELVGASPNPFNPNTTISFSVERPQKVRIAIFDMSGKLVAELANQTYAAGDYNVAWQGVDSVGRGVSSGTYLVQMETAELIESQKIMLVR